MPSFLTTKSQEARDQSAYLLEGGERESHMAPTPLELTCTHPRQADLLHNALCEPKSNYKGAGSSQSKAVRGRYGKGKCRSKDQMAVSFL